MDDGATHQSGGVKADRVSVSDDASKVPPVPPVQPAPATSPVLSSAPSWRTWIVAAVVLLAVGGLYLWVRANPQAGLASNPGSQAVIVQPSIVESNQPLTMTWRIVTAGPSPFNSSFWAVRMELSATGGNGHYIFWVNGERLPEVSNNQFTIEGRGCQPVDQLIGVTSDGQTAAQELSIYPPPPNNCPK